MRNVTMAAADDGRCHEPHRDAAMMAVAARQHGLITTAQLDAVGIRRGAVARRVQTGRLKAWCRGVYMVGPTALPWTAEMAALLTCGVERSGLSLWTSAAVWGLAPKPAIVDITVLGNVRSRDGVRVHRCTEIETVERHGLRVTTPTRTLEDLAPHLTQRELGRLVDEAHAQRLTLLPGRRSPALREALEAEPAITRSEAERRLRELVARAGLPRPRGNVRIGPYEVDLFWPRHNLIVEVDGYAFHSSRRAFERDRARDAHLTALGHRVMRVTWRQIVGEIQLVARLAAALAATP